MLAKINQRVHFYFFKDKNPSRLTVLIVIYNQ